MLVSTRLQQLARCQLRNSAASQLQRCFARRAPFPRVSIVKASVEPSTPHEEDFEGLLPEEDVEVPGTYQDAVNPNTKLGKVVKATCEELDALGKMEQDSLQQFNDKLKELGINIDIFAAPPASEQGEEDEEQEEEGAAASGAAEAPNEAKSSQPSS